MSKGVLRVSKQVNFEEVLNCYKSENLLSKSFEYADGLLRTADGEVGGRWTLVGISRGEILNIMLPEHRHPPGEVVIPKSGLAVSAAAERIKDRTRETGECWENILSHKDRDFSRTHIFLRYENGGLRHLDGLHRLLAWVIFEKKEEPPAYVAGVLPVLSNQEL
jgi:hypothetical protein